MTKCVKKRNTRMIKNINWCLEHFFQSICLLLARKAIKVTSHIAKLLHLYTKHSRICFIYNSETNTKYFMMHNKQSCQTERHEHSTVPSIALYCFSFCKGEVKCSLNYVTELNTQNSSYAYWTVHHLDIWIKVDQLDDTCLIIYCSTCFRR